MISRNYSTVDRLIIGLDQATRILFGHPQVTERQNPSQKVPDIELAAPERELAERLLRVNHTGEVCAHALYQGQALTTKVPETRAHLEQAVRAENDHLDWCGTRIKEVNGHTSLLNPVWYAGSFAIGALAGLAGDKLGLGLVAETEHQVESRLVEHLVQLPPQDMKSRAILEQMRKDEAAHAAQAIAAGGDELPSPLKLAMGLAARVIGNTSYWL